LGCVFISAVVEKADIPVLQIKEDFIVGNSGQIKTRVEA